MSDEFAARAKRVKALTETAGLRLPPERLEALVKAYSKFEEGFARVRALDTGDREPATLVPHEDPARRARR
jgi:hypothetical protein